MKRWENVYQGFCFTFSCIGKTLGIKSIMQSIKSLLIDNKSREYPKYVCEQHQSFTRTQLLARALKSSKAYMKCCRRVEQDPDEEDDPNKLHHLALKESERERFVKEIANQPNKEICKELLKLKPFNIGQKTSLDWLLLEITIKSLKSGDPA